MPRPVCPMLSLMAVACALAACGTGISNLPHAALPLPPLPLDPAPPEGPDTLPACARTVPVSGGALAATLAAALPGDCLIVADGAYGDLTLTGKGTAEAPIQVRAATALKATAGALVVTKSAYVVVQGFAVGTVLVDRCDHCRITRCQVKGGPGPAWIRIDEQKGCSRGCTDTPPGASAFTRFNHNDIGPGRAEGDIMTPTALSTSARIDHNHFHDVSGRHVITAGCCGPTFDYHDTNNGHRAEPVRERARRRARSRSRARPRPSATTPSATARGDVDIRAGRHDAIYGNYIFGPGGGGIRMYEDDHRVCNNYVETGKALQMGPPNAGHAPIKSAIVVHNTFIGSVARQRHRQHHRQQPRRGGRRARGSGEPERQRRRAGAGAARASCSRPRRRARRWARRRAASPSSPTTSPATHAQGPSSTSAPCSCRRSRRRAGR